MGRGRGGGGAAQPPLSWARAEPRAGGGGGAGLGPCGRGRPAQACCPSPRRAEPSHPLQYLPQLRFSPTPITSKNKTPRRFYLGLVWARIRPSISTEDGRVRVEMRRKPGLPLRGRGKALYQIPGPAAGDRAGNSSRVNRATWVPAGESPEQGPRGRAISGRANASAGGWGGRMDPDTRHSAGHPRSTAGKRFGGNPVEKF